MQLFVSFILCVCVRAIGTVQYMCTMCLQLSLGLGDNVCFMLISPVTGD